jgi:arylsulfate sulfotransferase
MNTNLRTYLWLICLFLAGCGSGSDENTPHTLAVTAQVGVAGEAAGATPFLSTLKLRLDHYADLTSVAYSIAPKPGTFSKAVAVTYTRAALERRGAYGSAERQLTLPIAGLYANHRNDVTVIATFSDGSTHQERLTVQTMPYSGAGAVYGAPDIKTARGAAAAPGFDFMLIKNGLTGPVVLDTDGNLRWAGDALRDSYSSMANGQGFFVGSGNTPDLYRLELDGTFTTIPLVTTRFTNFHHELAPGKTGILAELDALENGVRKFESVLAEISPTGEVLKEWDMGAIIRKAMLAHGDDPSNFVREDADWFHMNGAIYNAADDSLLVSSREHFVVKLDYGTGQIKWLLGDPTKHWYVDYPSLRALALRLTSGKAPIGQHTLSVPARDELLLFNNGTASMNQPPGTPAGANRTFSTPSRYRIDEAARTAAEVWSYDRDPGVYSAVCSSAYEASAGHYLVAYSVASGRTRARLLGVDTAGKVAFEFEFPTNFCWTAFSAQPIDMGSLTLQ